MDLEKSNIFFDENIWMYKIDFWFYTKYFDSFMISSLEKYKIKKIYWEKLNNVFFDENFDIDNYLIWFTKFYDNIIVCLVDLEDFDTLYFIVKSCYFFDYSLKGKNYIFFVYIDENNQYKLFHNCDLLDYEILFDTKIFQNIKIKCEININNNILWTPVFSKIIYLNELNNNDNIPENLNLNLSIADLFFFEDYFCALKQNFPFFEFINNKNFKVWDYYINIIINKYEENFFPKFKISFYIDSKYIDTINLKNILKFFLSIFPKQYVSYIIDNENIKSQFNDYFLNVNNLDFNKLDINFKISNNIFEFDEDFLIFQENFKKICYSYFSLKYNLDLVNNNMIENTDNYYLLISKIRLLMNKETLEITIKKYEEMLKKVIENINYIN